MNKKDLNAAILSLINKLEKTEKFVLQQAPEICKQMIKEKSFDIAIDLFLSLLAAIPSISTTFLLIYQIVRAPQDASDGYYGLRLLGLGIAALITIFGVCSTSDQIKYRYLVKNCPKLFLLREFRALLKK